MKRERGVEQNQEAEFCARVHRLRNPKSGICDHKMLLYLPVFVHIVGVLLTVFDSGAHGETRWG